MDSIMILKKAIIFILYPHLVTRLLGSILVGLIILLTVSWVTQSPKVKVRLSSLCKAVYAHRIIVIIFIAVGIAIMDVVLHFIPIELTKPLRERVTLVEGAAETLQRQVSQATDQIEDLSETIGDLKKDVGSLKGSRPTIVLREPKEDDPYVSVNDNCLTVLAEISDSYGIEESSIRITLGNEVIKEVAHIEEVSDTCVRVEYNIMRSFNARTYHVTLSARNILDGETAVIRSAILYYPVEDWTLFREGKRVDERHEVVEVAAGNDTIEWWSKKVWSGDIVIECWVKFVGSPPNFGIFFNSRYEVVFGNGNDDRITFKGGIGGQKDTKCSEITGFAFHPDKLYHLKIEQKAGFVNVHVDGKVLQREWEVDKICPKHLNGMGLRLYPGAEIYLSGFYVYSPSSDIF